MLAEPKTKRTRPELSLGLFGMGSLGHLQGLGLDPTGGWGCVQWWWGAWGNERCPGPACVSHHVNVPLLSISPPPNTHS